MACIAPAAALAFSSICPYVNRPVSVTSASASAARCWSTSPSVCAVQLTLAHALAGGELRLDRHQLQAERALAGRARRRGRCSAWRSASLRPKRASPNGRCWRARARARPQSTSLDTKPAARASAAVRRRPVNIRSLASRLPSTRGRRCVAPTVPRSASGVPNAASGVATMKSQAAAISHARSRAPRRARPRSPASAATRARRRRRRPSAGARAPGPRSCRLALLQVGAGAEHRAVAAHEHQPDTCGRPPARRRGAAPSHIAAFSALRASGRFERDGRDAAVDAYRARVICAPSFASSARWILRAVCSPSAGGRPISGSSQPRNL